MTHKHSFLRRRQKALMFAASLYVVALIVSHSTLPALHVWVIAAVFSIIMNATYVVEAYAARRLLRTELSVALVLIVASVLGVMWHPAFVIFAIFGHGTWDIAKHFGAGIPFFSWYTLSCFAVDMTYGLVLLVYFLGT
ncbi:MAG: hypothetical protein JXR13_06855 [Thalassovita sp.]